MKENRKINSLIQAKRVADEKISKMSPKEKEKLEIQLDVEHAYYSSALEGSRLDRKTFEELGKKVTA
jgi:hypothetical protein